ncbi:Type II restriction/modification system, DNA methylase subunit YeeA [Methylomagnum ishizawai]|uniref:site-specific DNA-methyltransferase (adenine-specific) n=1 Tax=Methylomagnum ishizawai TaxID=1760988 RepID=A0A1Y6D5D5_9GAMM|nr:DNA methyltransferase [Methylomagnum ishizawai]SMF95165.1 Type II restriction/modification system, DNA methylase subunit YeeA [Methylomagnum ishizawai]
MTPQEFIAKWKDNKLNERAGAQLHFIHLCRLLDVPEPLDPDSYCFERGKQTGQNGKETWWADVWKKGCFAWENKAPGVDLDKALEQVTRYADRLDNPPLLVVCDREMIRIKTRFNGHPSQTHHIPIEEIGRPENLQKLRNLFSEDGVETFRPKATTLDVTQAVARDIGGIATALIKRGHPKPTVSHFLIRIVFCLFAEDCGLLPAGLFARIIANSQGDPARFGGFLKELFRAMKKGGTFGADGIKWFNGGLFNDNAPPLPLLPAEIAALGQAAAENWNAIEPSIFGTLFENGLENRAERGAHYTDPKTIGKIIQPVVIAPLRAEWQALKDKVEAPLLAARAELDAAQKEAKKREKAILKAAQADTAGAKVEMEALRKRLGKAEKALNAARKSALQAIQAMLKRLNGFRVLDPACGSGNFLYLALRDLKNLEHEVGREAENWNCGFTRQTQTETSPANVMGIEIEPYAAELARVTVWIGEIQWLRENGYPVRENPVLQNLEHIENRDALMNEDGGEAEWPVADVIVGNPPFLGDKKMIGELGEDYVSRLRKLYKGRVPGGADLVTYWFEKARAQIAGGKLQRAGLVATNSIRGGASRKVLERICESGRIFEAWSDEEWVNDGAAVRVSLIGFSAKSQNPSSSLDGKNAETINSNLTSNNKKFSDLTKAKRLSINLGIAFIGTQKNGSFDIPGYIARKWINLPNPNSKSNRDVLRPWANGLDITRRQSDTWIIDFGVNMSFSDATLYEKPFSHIKELVEKFRSTNRREAYKTKWWIHAEARPGMRKAITGIKRYIATPRISKHRLFVWLVDCILPDCQIVVIARSDSSVFGILHSRFHELWSLRMGTSLEDRPRYTPATTFETFPFPEGVLTDPDPDARFPEIAAAAKNLNQLRENWLNPEIWVDWVQTPEEAAAGFPKRPVAKPGFEADVKKLTLTNLYNKPPAWLINTHQILDKAVAAAYGWKDYGPEWTDEDILSRLLALNLERAKNQAATPSTTEGEPDEDADPQDHEAPSAEPAPKRTKKAKPKTPD